MAGEPQLTVPVAGRADGDTAAPIEIRGVRQTFGEVVALDGIDLSIPAHTRLGIVGPSGCGKSTLLSDIAGLLEPDDGTISIGVATPPATARAARSCRRRTYSCRGGPRSTTRAWRSRTAATRGGPPGAGAPIVRALRPRRVRATYAGRAVRRDASARGLSADADGREGRAARRALRRPRLDHPRLHAGVAPRSARAGAEDGLARDA